VSEISGCTASHTNIAHDNFHMRNKNRGYGVWLRLAFCLCYGVFFDTTDTFRKKLCTIKVVGWSLIIHFWRIDISTQPPARGRAVFLNEALLHSLSIVPPPLHKPFDLYPHTNQPPLCYRLNPSLFLSWSFLGNFSSKQHK